MAEGDYFKEVFKESRTQMLLYPNFLKKRRIMNSEQFSTYESDIMKLLIQGEKNADIAKKLCVSENTVKYHLKNIYYILKLFYYKYSRKNNRDIAVIVFLRIRHQNLLRRP